MCAAPTSEAAVRIQVDAELRWPVLDGSRRPRLRVTADMQTCRHADMQTCEYRCRLRVHEEIQRIPEAPHERTPDFLSGQRKSKRVSLNGRE